MFELLLLVFSFLGFVLLLGIGNQVYQINGHLKRIAEMPQQQFRGIR